MDSNLGSTLLINYGGFGLLGFIAYIIIRWVLGQYNKLLNATLTNMTTLTSTLNNHLDSLVTKESENTVVLQEMAQLLKTHNTLATNAIKTVCDSLARLEKRDAG